MASTDDVGRAVAAEDADRVEVGLRGDARADVQRVAADGRRVVRRRCRSCRSRARRSRPPYPRRASRARCSRAGSGPGAGSAGSRRVRIGVVVVADQVDAALDARGRRAEQRRVGGRGVGRVRRVVGAPTVPGPPKFGVRVVDAGVDDRDLDALAVQAGEAVPHGRRADERHAALVVGLHRLQRADGDDAGQAPRAETACSRAMRTLMPL